VTAASLGSTVQIGGSGVLVYSLFIPVLLLAPSRVSSPCVVVRSLLVGPHLLFV
jgi:hypothetical protein